MATIRKQPFRPDLLADVHYPNSVARQLIDLQDRLDNLERYYGALINHHNLGNLGIDDHTQYALAAGTSDRDAVAYLSNGKNRFFLGSGAPSRPQNMDPAKGDYYHRTDTPTVANQRVYVCTTGGHTPTWQGIL